MQFHPPKAQTEVTLTDWERLAVAGLCRGQINLRLNRVERQEGDELDRMRWHNEIGLLLRLCTKMGNEEDVILDRGTDTGVKATLV